MTTVDDRPPMQSRVGDQSRPPPSFFQAAPAPFSHSHPHQPTDSNGFPVRHPPDASSSLSPRQDPQLEYPHQQQRALMLSRKMALNRNETVFVSSAGDVLVCRCRNSTYHPMLHQPPAERREEGLSKAISTCQKEMAVVCCEVDDLSLTAQDQNNGGLCGNWGSSSAAQSSQLQQQMDSYNKSTRSISPTLEPNGQRSNMLLNKHRGGLLGGAPAQVRSSPPPAPLIPEKTPSPGVKDRAQKAFQSEPISHIANGFDDESIVPIRSFDYSQFSTSSDDQNFGYKSYPRRSLSPNKAVGRTLWEDEDHREEKKSEAGPTMAIVEANKKVPQPPQLIHGVPTFLGELAQVKVTQVSAHPLGSHVLLISEAGLLYSYGLNDHGQLGLGKTTSLSSPQCGFIMTPTIVTPLIENGGKAIACAAGVSHSLVAVMTEERRLVRSQTSPAGKLSQSANQSTDLLRAHHQLYGFGRNDYMKIGLVSPKVSKNTTNKSGDEMEIVKLPRRVALRCRVPHHLHRNQQAFNHGPNSPPAGIFSISASEDHSAALVHRSSGDVELYTWGNANHGALGLPQQPITNSSHGQVNMSPTVRVVPVPSFVASLSKSSNPDAQASSLLLRHHGEHPVSVSLGKGSTFVTTSMGRAFSFGCSEDGMLGLGEGIINMPEPQEISLPPGETFTSVSAGAAHAVALSSSGSIYTWGVPNQTHSSRFANTSVPIHASAGGSLDGRTAGSSTAFSYSGHVWTPTQLPTPKAQEHLPASRWKKVDAVCAGYDSSTFIVDTGHVLSCGKSSGRLGLGETSSEREGRGEEEEVSTPRPLFGGLRLWYQQRSQQSKPLNQIPSKQNQPPMATLNDDSKGTMIGTDQRKPPPGLPRPTPLVRGSTYG